ncbi:MAG: sigma-70 family RNA polymerase sigma factor [Verrucomicrobia bacterium]|nr:sigma-70 family RNA polymerase sigma factor [Verrucomicrobiota bacterium]
MNRLTDQQLLRDYAGRRSEAAFAELVRRHIDLVYSAALRLVRDAPLAEDVTQGVFVALAQKARQLTDHPVLTGWLHRTAQNLATKVVRSEVRRCAREQEAATMNELLSAEPDAVWEHIAPHLDAALGELVEADRDALLLRFFKNQEFRTIGLSLGVSDDTAQKRVSRALERLRGLFAKRGVTLTGAAIAGAVSANAVQAAPVGLVASISTAAVLAGTVSATTVATISTMNWINAKAVAAIVSAAVLAGTGTYFVQQSQTNNLRADNQRLVAQKQTLTTDLEAAVAAAQANKDELERLQKNTTELLRLRNEVGQLRRQRDAEKQRVSQQSASTPNAAQPEGNVGAYISKEQLAFVGYATPEAALQSVTWVAINGTFEAAQASASPTSPEDLGDPKKQREDFEHDKKTKWASLKGMQIVAKKVLADDKAELKVRLDVDSLQDGRGGTPLFIVQPMVKVGSEWKAGSSGLKYQEDWERDGQIQTYGP